MLRMRLYNGLSFLNNSSGKIATQEDAGRCFKEDVWLNELIDISDQRPPVKCSVSDDFEDRTNGGVAEIHCQAVKSVCCDFMIAYVPSVSNKVENLVDIRANYKDQKYINTTSTSN